MRCGPDLTFPPHLYSCLGLKVDMNWEELSPRDLAHAQCGSVHRRHTSGADTGTRDRSKPYGRSLTFREVDYELRTTSH